MFYSAKNAHAYETGLTATINEARELVEGKLANRALSQRLATLAEGQHAARKSTDRHSRVRFFVNDLRTRVSLGP